MKYLSVVNNTGEHIFFAWEVRPVLRYIDVTEFEYGNRFFPARHVFCVMVGHSGIKGNNNPNVISLLLFSLHINTANLY